MLSKINRSQLRIGVLTLLFVVGFAFMWFLSSLVTPAEFKAFVHGLGAWGPFLLIVYIVVGQVIAPISGTPAAIAGFALFGVEVMLIFYIANMISAVINFYISRLLGRRWVKHFGGKKTLDKIDVLLSGSETRLLVLGRTLGFPIFDIISYAMGFTKISFKKYFWITALLSWIPTIVIVLLFHDIEINLKSIAWFALTIFAAGAFFALFVEKKLIKKGKI